MLGGEEKVRPPAPSAQQSNSEIIEGVEMKRVVGVLLLLVGAFVLSSCAGMSYKEQFKDPSKSFVVLWVRYGPDAWGDVAYLTNDGKKPTHTLYHFRNEAVIEKPWTCMAFGGLVENGVYELYSLESGSVAYRLKGRASSDIKLNVTKPDIYYLGEFELTLSSKGGLLSNGTFNFNKAAVCGGEKAAYREILRTDDFVELFKDTHWANKVSRKAQGAK